MKTIAKIYTEFPEKFGVPRQSGLVEELEGKIIFEKPYRFKEAVRGLEEFSHLWLIWEFSENKEKPFSPTVRPPRLGGNKRLGVFATRSPFRPNRLGLSSVKIKSIDLSSEQAPVITVSGADLVSGTPILDIKPYVESDVHADAVFGFTQKVPFQKTTVIISDELSAKAGKHLSALKKVLENRPVPAYQHEPERIYGMDFAGKSIRFKIEDDILTVTDISDNA
ncbi:MAG: tRNA (N6-threonylcarbamoyladenosine(37)-N6)-methyltransferase TrmO [Clostridia bacterium]|nr:tRNA (N6-threonylcarbamoyladenosine(37)-N6)-methyltransferase TrmO [Clostridia bacterium]